MVGWLLDSSTLIQVDRTLHIQELAAPEDLINACHTMLQSYGSPPVVAAVVGGPGAGACTSYIQSLSGQSQPFPVLPSPDGIVMSVAEVALFTVPQISSAINRCRDLLRHLHQRNLLPASAKPLTYLGLKERLGWLDVLNMIVGITGTPAGSAVMELCTASKPSQNGNDGRMGSNRSPTPFAPELCLKMEDLKVLAQVGI